MEREADEKAQLEVDLKVIREALERKEFFMQAKEKKWLEVENVMAPYVDSDQLLKDKFTELKLTLTPDYPLRSVVGQNETLKKELKKAYSEIDRLRLLIRDPYKRFKKKTVNKEMAEK